MTTYMKIFEERISGLAKGVGELASMLDREHNL